MSLEGKVAVVTGASRGAGRGIALALGEAGATVYVTGRSTRASPTHPDLAGTTIEETAEQVCERGGVGIAVQVDHTQDPQVAALFERVREEQGRIDILVNDVWGGDPVIEWGKSFWELDVAQGWRLLERSVYSHILTSRYAVPLMVERDAGLIVEVTDGDSLSYRGNFFYDLVKTTVIRLAYAMAEEFKGNRHNVNGEPDPTQANITAVALTPGFLRSEAMLDHFGVTEANWRDAIAKDPYYAESETPHYIGRAVVALACDPNVHQKAGKALATWHLSREYGFKDMDGRQPHWQEFFDRMQARKSSVE